MSETGFVDYIIKRNGEKQKFDFQRIYNAIDKAFKSEDINNVDLVSSVSHYVLDMINIVNTENKLSSISVEQIQDFVEQALMSQGFHKIARNYILYREKHAIARQEKTIQQVQEKKLTIKLSDSETIVYEPDSIEQHLKRLSFGLYKINISSMIESITKQVYDGIPQVELDQLILGAVRERIETHYEYSSLASRIVLDKLYGQILKSGIELEDLESSYKQSFSEFIAKGVELELLNPELQNFDLDKLANSLNINNDYLFHYLGTQILVDRYFLKDRAFKQTIIELPQWFWRELLWD